MATEEIITQEDNPHALIVRAPDERAAMVLMDRMDLEQAMAELRGEVIQTFVYVAKDGKKQPTYAGIKEAARLYRNVHFGATATPLADGSWMITSYAHNLADNTRCDYPMPYPSFDPRDTRQAIEFRASISKSIRNALAAVLPIAYLNTMITRWMEEKSAGQQSERGASRPPAPIPTRAHAAPAATPAATVARPVAARESAESTTFTEQAAAALRGPEAVPPLELLDNDGGVAELRAEVAALLAADGPALELLKAKGTLSPDMTPDQLRKTKDWLLERERRNVPLSERLSRTIGAAGTPEVLRTAQQAIQQAKDGKGISQTEYVGLLREVEARRQALAAGPLTAGARQPSRAAGAQP